MGQIDHVAHLRVGKTQQVGNGIGRDHIHIHKGRAVAYAQAVAREDKDKVLSGLFIEAEGDEHGIFLPQVGHKAGAGAPGRVAVQAWQHVFHAGHAVAVAGQVVARPQGGGDFAAGKVLQGYAHGSDPLHGWQFRPGRQFAAAVPRRTLLARQVAQCLAVGPDGGQAVSATRVIR